MKEQWKPIPECDGYEVSNMGNARSLDRVITRKDAGHGAQARRKGRSLNPTPVLSGWSGRRYRSILIAGKMHKVSKLVLEAFVGPRPPGNVVRHLNDESLDDRLVNLAWGTYSENAIDRTRNGRNPAALKTHCPQGHPYSAENTNVRIRGNGRPTRECITCRREQSRERRRKNRGLQ